MDIQKQHEDFYLWWEGNAIAMMCEEDEALKIWQAAKSKAVPEGFVLVPKEPTLKMSIAYQKNAIAPVSSLSISGYKAMIEAQEQNQ